MSVWTAITRVFCVAGEHCSAGIEVEGNPKLEQMMNTLTDEEVAKAIRHLGAGSKKIRRFRSRQRHRDKPAAVILVKTVRATAWAHRVKAPAPIRGVLSADERVGIAAELGAYQSVLPTPRHEGFIVTQDDAPEITYLRDRRQAKGGWLPSRSVGAVFAYTELAAFGGELLKGSGQREVSTTGDGSITVDLASNAGYRSVRRAN